MSDKLPKVVSFDALVEHGKASGAPLYNGMPWSFTFEGHPVTHENDQCYLIGTEGERFTPDAFMVIAPSGKFVFMRA